VDHVTRHNHRARFSLFALIGAGVFFAGLVLQVLLVRYAHIGPDPSYAAQAIFSIELSYLLNRHLTWRDRSVGWWAAAAKFNAQKLIMTVINLAAYALLVRLGLEYVVANVVLTAIFTPINYFAADVMVFARGARRGVPNAYVEPWLPAVLPTVSVVIPCKSSERTIRETVESFLAQDYPQLIEVILVGDVGDPTWAPLADVRDSRLVLIEQEKTPGRRDPNVKRDKGIKKSSGSVIALADSDIVVDPGWLGRAVALLNGQGGGLVAGGMRSIHDTFWGRFVDNNVLAAKTPRVSRPYQVTAETFGARGHKPPVTANAIFIRALYDSCPLDVNWAYGYEDYEWFWRLAKHGHAILFSAELTAAHHHRRSFKHLVREYRQSAYGCAQFIRAHPDSPLARKRTIQAFGLPLGALGVLGLGALAVADGYGELVAGALAMAAVLVVGREVSRTRSLEAITYPPAALALGGIYAASIASTLMRPPDRKVEAPTWSDSGPGPAPRQRPWHQRISWSLTAILALQAGLSLSLIWSNTAFADEANYLWQGHLEWAHWLHGAPVPPFHDSGAAQIYPPIGALADSLGGLAGARALSAIFMLGATFLLYKTGSQVFGKRAALVAAALWALSEPVLRLSFATYDPLACLFIALSTWLLIRATVSPHRGELVLGGIVALALGSVTAVSFAIMIPAVIAFTYLAWRSSAGPRAARWCAGWLAGGSVVLTAGIMTWLHMWQDAIGSTVSRRKVHLDTGVTAILRSAWSWDGLLCAIAALGIIVAFTRERSWTRRLLVAAAGLSGLLVPAYQAHIGTGWSLDKHMSASTWFMALAAGYGISQFSLPSRKPFALGCALVAFLAYPAIIGTWYARSAFGMWPNEAVVVSALAPLVNHTQGAILASNDPVPRYYLPQVNWWRWQAATGYPPAALAAGKIALVLLQLDGDLQSNTLPQALVSTPSGSLSGKVLQLATANPGLAATVQEVEKSKKYRLVSVVPYVTTNASQSNGVYAIWELISSFKGGKIAQTSSIKPNLAHVAGR
jgi:putative flippase GtrA